MKFVPKEVISLIIISTLIISGFILYNNTIYSMNGFSKVRYVGSNLGNHISAKYDFFNASEEREVKLKKNSKLRVKRNSQVKRGQLKMYLINEEDKVVHEFLENVQEVINIDLDGSYKFLVEGMYTKGNFEIEWEEEK